MLNINTSDRKEQRKFGLVMAAAVAALGLLHWALHGFEHFPVLFSVVAALFAVFGLAWPGALKPLFIGWIKFAMVLNWVVTYLLLTAVFFLIIVPMGLVMRVFSEDPLKRRRLPAGASCWEAPDEQPEIFNRYKDQF